VLREEGAKLRKSYSLESDEIGFCPIGTILTVTEKRYVEVANEAEYTARVRVISPPEWKGWASLKDHILEAVTPEAAGLGPDPTVLAEIDRRKKLKAQRKLKFRMRQKVLWSKSRRRLVSTKGTLDVSKDTFFLLKKPVIKSAGSSGNEKSGPKISADFCSVTGDESNNHRTLAFGSRGFSKGVHYW
jgi:hypothetical protein